MTTPVTPSDFSGVLTIAAPSATAANNAAGLIVQDQVSSLHYLSLGSTTNGGSLAQNQPINVMPLFPHKNKMIRNVSKKTGQTWTLGQKLYVATGSVWQTTSTGGTLDAIAASTQASADTLGDIVPASPS